MLGFLVLSPRYSYSYSKTPESIQVDHPFREAGTPVFGPLVNEIPILLFEYEYEKNQWYELPATIMPDGLPSIRDRRIRLPAKRFNSLKTQSFLATEPL